MTEPSSDKWTPYAVSIRVPPCCMNSSLRNSTKHALREEEQFKILAKNIDGFGLGNLLGKHLLCINSKECGNGEIEIIKKPILKLNCDFDTILYYICSSQS